MIHSTCSVHLPSCPGRIPAHILQKHKRYWVVAPRGRLQKPEDMSNQSSTLQTGGKQKSNLCDLKMTRKLLSSYSCNQECVMHPSQWLVPSHPCFCKELPPTDTGLEVYAEQKHLSLHRYLLVEMLASQSMRPAHTWQVLPPGIGK